MEHDANKNEIWQFATLCKATFTDCLSTPALREQAWVRSAHGDFNLWCAGIKATKPSSDKSSLDYRLRKHTWKGIREDICDLLRGLLEALRKCQDLSKGMHLSVQNFHCASKLLESSRLITCRRSSDTDSRGCSFRAVVAGQPPQPSVMGSHAEGT